MSENETEVALRSEKTMMGSKVWREVSAVFDYSVEASREGGYVLRRAFDLEMKG